ncbi:hypothetical protein V8E54_000171 [Elaphomyces granulatus]
MERRPEDRAIEENVKEVPEADMGRRPEGLAVEENVNEVLALAQAQRRRDDRGLATIKDGYTAKQIPDMTRAVWRNALAPQTSEQSIRTNLDFLLRHAMLLRQGNRLAMFSMEPPRQGAKPGASSSFWTTESQDWYLLKRDNPLLQEQLNSDTAADWSKRLYGVRMSKVSYAPLVSADPPCGRWNNDQMTGCYLTNLPFEFMRGRADFEPAFPSSYDTSDFLARDVQPPESFRRMHILGTEKVEPNLAAGAFLELLDRLRDVLLQDAALRGVNSTSSATQSLRPRIQKALPVVCDSLRTVTGVVKTGEEDGHAGECGDQFLQRRLHLHPQEPQSPGATAAARPSRGSSLVWTDFRSNAHRELGGTAANTPLVAGQLRWRHGAEFQFYSRRKVIIAEIKRLVARGREAREVVDSLEAQRVRTKASLSQVIKGLKAAAKAREGGN